MRLIGCIPTAKFVTDLNLVRDITYALKTLKSSVLMFPEAGYSFDGTATKLPDSLGHFVKRLGVPLVTITTYGAFARDPLYNNLQRRRVPVTATMEYVLSPEEIAALPEEEIAAKITEKFSFDNFRWQQEHHVRIDEPFRADFLNRLLYKCPACGVEGQTEGKGDTLRCHACGKSWVLDEYGYLSATEGETEFSHIPDWMAWQRQAVREELEQNNYLLDVAVEIYMLVDEKCLYHVGQGRLHHDKEGFHLTGCDGQIDYRQDPLTSYTLNADFNWYEIGDVISIGNNRTLYYCFPKDTKDVATKARLATEELYEILSAQRKEKRLQATK